MARRKKRLNKKDRKERRRMLLVGGGALGAGLIGSAVYGAMNKSKGKPPGREMFGPPIPKKIAKRIDLKSRRKRALGRMTDSQKNRLSNKYGYDLEKMRFNKNVSKSSKNRALKILRDEIGRFSFRFMGSGFFV